MASISSVITGGFGVPGSAALVITDGYGQLAGAYVPPVIVSRETPGGVRKARFLRRAPRLPWEKDDEPVQQEVVVAKTRRKRIQLPEAEALQAVAADVPVQLFTEITGPVIKVPDIPVKLDDDDDEELLWLI